MSDSKEGGGEGGGEGGRREGAWLPQDCDTHNHLKCDPTYSRFDLVCHPLGQNCVFGCYKKRKKCQMYLYSTLC